MERRNFLGLLVAGAAYPFLPAQAIQPLVNEQIWTAATLTAEMEKMFACRMGPAMPFFEMIRGSDKIIEVKPEYRNERIGIDAKSLPEVHEFFPPAEQHDRYIYQTYGFAIQGGDAQEAEHKLAKHFYDEFSKLDTKNLVWRRKPEFQSQEVTEYGEVWMTADQVEDKHWRLANWIDDKGRERTRYDQSKTLEIPDGVELDSNTNDYRYVTRKYPLHRMTMRLVFTDRKDIPVSLARQEGAPLPRI